MHSSSQKNDGCEDILRNITTVDLNSSAHIVNMKCDILDAIFTDPLSVYG